MLELDGVVVRFGETAAVDGVSLQVGGDETVVLLGPSGCGKSTLLRAIAGLEPLANGRVQWDGRDLDDVPPHRRGFGLMFQDYALFPHRDVRANVAFGPKMAGMTGAARDARVAEVLALVGLHGFERRRVSSLSGGEQQRVALARALAAAPRLLMLDEPLGALDRVLRERLVDELRALLRGSALPAIYVTHDHEEAFALADRVVLMRRGRIVQVGEPADVWARPADAEAALFLGFTNTGEGVVEDGYASGVWGRIPVPAGTPRGPARLVLRPDALRIDEQGDVRGRVTDVTFAGEHSGVRLKVDAHRTLEVRVASRGAPSVGDEVRVRVSADGVLVYPER